MKRLSTADIFIIRACKSPRDPLKRLQIIHRRFHKSEGNLDQVMYTLARLCEGLCDIKIGNLLADLSPQADWYFKGASSEGFYGRAVRVLASKLRLINADSLPGYIPSLPVRRRLEQMGTPFTQQRWALQEH